MEVIMTKEEETRFLRHMQEADNNELRKYFSLREVKTEEREAQDKLNYTCIYFDVSYLDDIGYLKLGITDDGKLILAEMNVNFITLIGLNRSPLELKILSENVLHHFSSDIYQKKTCQ